MVIFQMKKKKLKTCTMKKHVQELKFKALPCSVSKTFGQNVVLDVCNVKAIYNIPYFFEGWYIFIVQDYVWRIFCFKNGSCANCFSAKWIYETVKKYFLKMFAMYLFLTSLLFILMLESLGCFFEPLFLSLKTAVLICPARGSYHHIHSSVCKI